VTCHGAEGKGDGPAAAALNPKPRNFTDVAGWSNGRKPSKVFGTLTKGLRAMPSFSSLPSADRWAMAHYVGSFGPNREEDSDADLRAAGVDPNKDDTSSAPAPSIPVEMAIDEMSEG
jgi:mono/diheme cytochrome c family protein